MFYQADKIIVFQIDRLLPFDSFDGLEGDVALNDVDINSENVNSIDLDYDKSEVVLAANNNDEDFKDTVDKFTKTYNLSDLDRRNMQSREEYRRLHLRPNGKPYQD
ncbi:MAG: hypothetical protein HRU26_13865 [Psychroserpens sp.]|nr:hypothetical protein [Psychroserpens sp.]